MVLSLKANKLKVAWEDPFVILDKLDQSCYLIKSDKLQQTPKVIHINTLNPYYKEITDSQHQNDVCGEKELDTSEFFVGT